MNSNHIRVASLQEATKVEDPKRAGEQAASGRRDRATRSHEGLPPQPEAGDDVKEACFVCSAAKPHACRPLEQRAPATVSQFGDVGIVVTTILMSCATFAHPHGRHWEIVVRQ